MEECSDHGESRDWWRHCSDRAERGGRQENEETQILWRTQLSVSNYDFGYGVKQKESHLIWCVCDRMMIYLI